MEKWSNLLSIQTLGEAMSLAKKAQAARGSGLTVYPPQSQIFHALTLTKNLQNKFLPAPILMAVWHSLLNGKNRVQ